MTHSIEDLWFALSDLFIDNEIDYAYIASEIADYDLDIIEFHLFYNVAPFCAPNLEQLIPPIWAGFDRKDLIENILKDGIMDPSQITFFRKLSAKRYKYKYSDDWSILKEEINKIHEA